MDRQPFRFAVQATNASSAREWREFVCTTEDVGYSCLMLADHYLGPGPAQQAARTPRQDLAPIAAIAAAAAYTSVLRVGCRVFCIEYHVPAV
ncbi:MAG TPA: LLM class F420-dependent oxidoreductase, partial [Mycobacterium sp.]|nr:LLM class F420-dependent oxidoreductase [Mycobacterium sp.]